MVSIHINVTDQYNNPIAYNWKVAAQDNISEQSGTGYGDSYIGISHDQTNQTAQITIWLEDNPSVTQSFSAQYYGFQDIGNVAFIVTSTPIPAPMPETTCTGVISYRGVMIWDNNYCQEFVDIWSKWWIGSSPTYPSVYLPNAGWLIFYPGTRSTTDTGSVLIPYPNYVSSVDEAKSYIDNHPDTLYYLFDGSIDKPYPLDVPTPVVPTTGSLLVQSSPSNATIYLDYINTGKLTPYTFTDLSPGTHKVGLQLSGYQAMAEDVVIVAGETTDTGIVTMPPVSSPEYGNLNVISTPSGASISLDGSSTGETTPHTFMNLISGKHYIELSLINYQTLGEDINITPNETTEHNKILEYIGTTCTLPSCSFTITDKTTKVGTIVSFEDKSNEPTATYTWDFGDGGTSTLKDDTHTYNNIGLYSVVHTVTNTCGTTTCPIKTIEVVTELPPSGVSSTVMLMGAALLGFMMISKKK